MSKGIVAGLLIVFAVVGASGCSTISGVASVNKDLKVLSDPAYRSAAPDDDRLFDKMVADLGADLEVAVVRSRKWDRAEGLFNAALLAAAAYGGFNTVYDGGNLEDAAFAAASITSLRTFARPKDRRDAYAQAANELACVRKHAGVFSAPAAFSASLAGGSKLRLLSLGSDANAASSSDLETKSARINALIDGFGDLEQRGFADGKNYTAKQARSIGARQEARVFQFNALVSGVERLVSANKKRDEIRNERFALVYGEYVDIVNALFKALRFREVVYSDELASFAKAKAESEAMKNAAATTEGALTANGLPEGIALSLFDEAKKYAEAKEAILACHAQE
ncbi:MAG TPA: hypothetical protein DEA40_02105 [Parvularcula sp.]|nr:hypothetical protein [Parvularcula sp.]HBS35113.1 hypothetical protein [Parvularcula sp.]